ncbi:MAG: 50S ribosomal protein L18 [Deltaproteobacteria bacterium]|nr:50S ribosomal protein L18 [Deltaproteobacteria bacterium]HCH63690.1 50S ribosomal protein L18 [Deltaproteobacteria bacterium]
MSKSNQKRTARFRRKAHIRKSIRGTAARPRLSVFRSASHIYAQVVDDVSGRTIVAANTLQAGLKGDGDGGNIEGAKRIGAAVAERALAEGVQKVVFDRNGFLFHGRVKALADAARAAGLQF